MKAQINCRLLSVADFNREKLNKQAASSNTLKDFCDLKVPSNPYHKALIFNFILGCALKR